MAFQRRTFLAYSIYVATLGLASTTPLRQALAASTDKQLPSDAIAIKAAKAYVAALDSPVSALKILIPTGSRANIEPIAASFTQKTAIPMVLLETAVDDVNTKIFIDTASNNNSFDIALPATFGLPDLIEANAIVNLGSYAQRYEPVHHQTGSLYSLGDYYKGALYGYQADGDIYLMFYRQDWLADVDNQQRFEAQHGYPLAIPKTWQQLDALMAFFHDPDNGRYGGLLYRTPTYMAWEWWCRFHAKGLYPVAADMTPQIDNPAGIEALEELIAASKSLHPSAATNTLFENWDTFAAGETFCNIGWGGTQKYLHKRGMSDTLTYGPTPGMNHNGQYVDIPYFNWGWNYVVSSLSQHPELAYLFTLYASSPACSTKAVRQADGFFDPYRPTHYDDVGIRETYGGKFLAVHQASLKNSIPDFYISGQGAYLDSLRRNIADAVNGVVSAEEALHLAAKEWHHITQRIGLKSQVEQWTYLRQQYPSLLQKILQ